MTDRRLLAANERVALRGVDGLAPDVVVTDGTLQTINRPVADLSTRIGGTRDRQLLLGTQVTVLEHHQGQAFVQTPNGYVGYVASEAIGAHRAATHRVATFATHAYRDEDFKSPERMALPFGARLSVLDERRKFYETDQGFVPKSHLRPLDRPFQDPGTIAQLHFGVPYLWGGNSTRGIDCSGLISAALTACDMPCPDDSDLQRDGLGRTFDDAPQRGDLIFWQGHVAMMVDEDVLIHANAHAMAVCYEPLERATLRIAAQGDGPVIARKRL